MTSRLGRLAATLELTLTWTYRIIRVRYRQSVLGGLWAIVQPAATVGILSIIFVFFIPINTGQVPYLLFSSAAVVPWALFSSSTSDMVDSLVGNMGLISKVYFPREVLPLSAVFARLVDFAISVSVIALLLILYRMPVFAEGLIFLPLLVLLQICLALGLGLFGAALNVFYRDIRQIFFLALQIWAYATPIIYPVTAVPKSLLPFFYANPMVGIIVAYRSILFDHTLPGSYLFYSAAVSVVTLCLGFLFFKRVEFQFADVV